MNWINVKDKHFVDITYETENKYSWIENNNCPQEPFLVAISFTTINTGEVKWEIYRVILTEYGLREVADDDNFDIGYEVTDIEYWCKIENPSTNP